jgi:hypothetical protein
MLRPVPEQNVDMLFDKELAAIEFELGITNKSGGQKLKVSDNVSCIK